MNTFQSKIKDVTRKMMATVSELSMYQATAMKLTSENTAKDEALREMEANLEQGVAPSEDIEREWLRYEDELERRAHEPRGVLVDAAPCTHVSSRVVVVVVVVSPLSQSPTSSSSSRVAPTFVVDARVTERIRARQEHAKRRYRF